MTPPTAETYYATLGLAPDASAEDIERAFRRRAFETHPDHNPSDPAAAGRFRSVRTAYETLRDPVRRARYDATLAVAARRTPKARPTPPPPAEIVIRKGRPQTSDVPTGLLVGLVEAVSRSVLIAVGLFVASLIGTSMAGWLPVGIILLDVLIVGLVFRYVRARRARHEASPPQPTGEVRFRLDAEGLYDRRRDVRLDWAEVRGYVVSWPEDWMDLTLTPEAAERLRPSGVVGVRGGRAVYRLDLKGTDGELVDVERLLKHVMHRPR